MPQLRPHWTLAYSCCADSSDKCTVYLLLDPIIIFWEILAIYGTSAYLHVIVSPTFAWEILIWNFRDICDTVPPTPQLWILVTPPNSTAAPPNSTRPQRTRRARKRAPQSAWVVDGPTAEVESRGVAA